MLCYPTHYIRSISKKRAIFLENTHILKISQPVSPFWLFFFQTIPLIQKISKLSLHEPSLPATRPLLLSHCPGVFHPPPLPFFPTTHPLLLLLPSSNWQRQWWQKRRQQRRWKRGSLDSFWIMRYYLKKSKWGYCLGNTQNVDIF